MPRTFVCWLLLILWSPLAVAQATNDLSTLGLALTGPPLALEGDLVMETVGLNNVIRDHTDPAQPTLVGWLPHHDSGFYGHRVHDDGLVVALHSGLPWGFDIIDVADPTAPAIVHSSTGATWSSAWLRDEILLLSSGNLAIAYHLDDPTTPFVLGAVNLGDHEGRRWFAAVGDVLYAIDRGARLRAIGLDQAAPVDLGTVVLDATRIEAMATGDGVLYAVVSGTDRRLLTLRPQSALQLELTSDLLLSADTELTDARIIRRDQALLVSPGDGTVRVLDVTVPQTPTPRTALAHGGEELAITQNQYLSLADGLLRIVDRETLEQVSIRPVIPGYRTIMGSGAVVLAQRDDLPHVVVPVDISNPEVPLPGDGFDLEFGDRLSYEDGLLVVSDGSSRFDVWDASDPRALVKLSSVEEPEILFGSAFIDGGRVAFFNFIDGGIALYDLSDPTAPRRATGIHTSYPRAYHDGLMLSGVGSPLRLFTAHDPHRPKLASRVFLNGSPLAATLAPGLLLVSVERLPGEVTLHLFATTDPSDVVELSTLPLPGRATNLVVHGNRVYAQGYHTTWVVDITNALEPSLDGEFATWGLAGRGLAFHGDLTLNSGWLVSLHDAGYVITDTPSPGLRAAVLHPAYPNPFNPSTTVRFEVVRPGRYELAVYDLRGRLVAGLMADELAVGLHSATWNGLDGRGRRAASGAYLLRLTGEALEAQQTITLVK